MISQTPIGMMRHKITIEVPSTSSDGQGGFTRTGWTTKYTAWAFIEPLSANQRIFADQKAMAVSHKITLRYRKDQSPDVTMRVNYTQGSTTRYFQITGLMNVDERNRYLTLLCKEGVGA